MLTGYEHLVGGFCGGLASTICCHPFDLLRVRYSANEGNKIRPQYTSYANAITSIYKSRGIRGLYQGLSPAIIGSSLSWGLYFHIIRPNMKHFLPEQYVFINNLLAGNIAGAIVLALTNPIWICKTRLCLQYENQKHQYSGLRDCFYKVYKHEGVRGFYKNTIDYFCFTIVSKIIPGIITFPYQVIRTRLQDQNVNYNGAFDCIRKTFRREGIYGFYKGVWISTVKQLPATIVTYIVYEHTRHLMENFNT